MQVGYSNYNPFRYVASRAYEQTIFFALSNSNIEAAQARYKEYGRVRKIALGIEM